MIARAPEHKAKWLLLSLDECGDAVTDVTRKVLERARQLGDAAGTGDVDAFKELRQRQDADLLVIESCLGTRAFCKRADQWGFHASTAQCIEDHEPPPAAHYLDEDGLRLGPHGLCLIDDVDYIRSACISYHEYCVRYWTEQPRFWSEERCTEVFSVVGPMIRHEWLQPFGRPKL